MNLDLGKAYGTAVPALGAEQRAMFVVNAENVVCHVDYVQVIGSQPDYDAALAVVKSLL